MTAMALLVNEKYPKPASNARQKEGESYGFFATIFVQRKTPEQLL
jgi:hypothetical protein